MHTICDMAVHAVKAGEAVPLPLPAAARLSPLQAGNRERPSHRCSLALTCR
jgi:hypothetical protein